jgi:hypothetical protein
MYIIWRKELKFYNGKIWELDMKDIIKFVWRRTDKFYKKKVPIDLDDRTRGKILNIGKYPIETIKWKRTYWIGHGSISNT